MADGWGPTRDMMTPMAGGAGHRGWPESVLVGQLDIHVPGVVKTVFFDLFLFATGYTVPYAVGNIPLTAWGPSSWPCSRHEPPRTMWDSRATACSSTTPPAFRPPWPSSRTGRARRQLRGLLDGQPGLALLAGWARPGVLDIHDLQSENKCLSRTEFGHEWALDLKRVSPRRISWPARRHHPLKRQ